MLQERDRWRWEGPASSAWSGGLDLLPLSVQLAVLLRMFMIFPMLGAMLWVGIGFRNNPLQLPMMFTTMFVSMLMLWGLERWISFQIPASIAQIRMLNQIASVSYPRRLEIEKFNDKSVLSFAVAKRICRENVGLRDEAERRTAVLAAGPQASCETTKGPHVILRFSGESVVFVPCEDGWYRFHNRNPRLHRMLAAGAAGSDAGLYWVLNHQEGVWGIPSVLIKSMQDRLDSMSRTI